jgi:nickel-dependent lactate racemase
MAILQYGERATLRLDLPDGFASHERGMPTAAPLADMAATLRQVLREPLEYPSLAASTTPGDRVVIAMDCHLPQFAQIAATIVDCLLEAGVQADGIAMLFPPTEANQPNNDPAAQWEVEFGMRAGAQVKTYRHNPYDRRGLAYLASGRSGEPILLNRLLHEADLVLPVGCLCPETTAGYFGPHGVVFPAFSDARTIARFRASQRRPSHMLARRRLIAEVNEVAWLLGINFTIQVIPGPGESILNILAGQSEAVSRLGRSEYRAAWTTPPVPRAKLVIAAISGGPSQQTWSNLGRAINAAVALVEPGGVVAICCELATEPGPAVQWLAEYQTRRRKLGGRELDHAPDLYSAAAIIAALEHSRLYLLSRLDPTFVRRLHITPVDAAQLAQLARNAPSCVLLSNAPCAIVPAVKE